MNPEFPPRFGNEVVFIYRGPAAQVELIGDMTCWNRTLRLYRVADSDVFALRQTYEEDARLDYKLVVDGRYVPDPLNPHVVEGGFGANSELRMPLYRPRTEAFAHAEVPRGEVERGLIGRHTYAIYRPHGFCSSRRYRVIYFQDGGEYLQAGRAAQILDYAVAHGWIEPVVAVFVDPLDRMAEYATNDAYVSFFVHELMPHVETQFLASGERTLVGDSMGGLISVYLALRHPHLFDSVLSHSGAFPGAFSGGITYGREYRIEPFGARLASARLPQRFHLVVGKYETDVIGYDYVAANQRVYEALRSNRSVRGCELSILPQGHSWGLWRDTLGEGLRRLLSYDASRPAAA
jgi:enterochelin esterase family protein